MRASRFKCHSVVETIGEGEAAVRLRGALALAGGIQRTQVHDTAGSLGQVRARTSGGDFDLGNIKGPVDARTSGGDMSITSVRGRLDLNTSGGDIKIGEADGPASAKTSGGSIEVHRVGGDLFAHTSGGSISIDEASGAIDGERMSRRGCSPRAIAAISSMRASAMATSGINSVIPRRSAKAAPQTK